MALINGGFGNDNLVGTSAVDDVFGLDGEDVIDGMGGADRIYGGLGNDTIRFTVAGTGTPNATGIIDGGLGFDTIDATAIGSSAVALDLLNWRFFAGTQAFTLSNVETIRLGAGVDTITNSSLSGIFGLTIFAGGGNDLVDIYPGLTVFGEAGDDTFHIASHYGLLTNSTGLVDGGIGNDTLLIDPGHVVDLSASTVTGGSTVWQIANFENLVLTVNNGGGAAVTGDDNGNVLTATHTTGAAGVAVFDGRGGDDTLVGAGAGDTLRGGDGNDRIQGQGGADQLYGDAGDDRLEGGEGADQLFGGAGNDQLIGGTGADAMTGGLGDDLYQVDDLGDAVNEAAGEGADTVEVSVDGYVLGANIETLRLVGAATTASGNAGANILVGNAAANTLNGQAGDDILDGGGGDDVLNGGDGNDTVVFSGNRADYTITDLGNGTYTISGPGGTDTINGVELLSFADRTVLASDPDGELGTPGNDVLYGTNGGDHIHGLGGNDTLFGEDGQDILDGEDGNDILVGNTDIFAQETDWLNGAAGDDLLYGEFTDVLNGGAGRDSLIAVNAYDFTLDLAATSIEYAILDFGNDIIDASAQAVRVDVFASGGNDRVTGSNFDDALFGSVGDDTIVGGLGNDALVGESGIDSLNGGGGDDRIYFDNQDSFVFGGAGYDVGYITQGTGAGTVVNMGASQLEFLQDLAGAGDTVLGATATTSFFAFTGDGNDTIEGSAFADTLWGEAGDDSIDGGAGADVIVGGAGLDRINGGAGNDFLYGGSEAGVRDTFAFTSSGAANADRIYDFVTGTDRLDLTGLGATFADVSFTVIGGNSVVYVDGQIVCTLVGVTTLSGGDFILESGGSGQGLASGKDGPMVLPSDDAIAPTQPDADDSGFAAAFMDAGVWSGGAHRADAVGHDWIL